MDLVLQNAWLIPVFPLVGAIVNGLVGMRLGRKAVGLLACAMMGLAFLMSVGVYFALPQDGAAYIQDLFDWIPMGTASAVINAQGPFEAAVGYLIDPLSTTMILVVTGVGFLIHVYSLGYMGHDPDYSRFFTYLNLFAAAMLTLVLANNFLLMFVGWEGVGLCSYLLIGFWYQKDSAAAAGKKAFIINRVGDFGFVLGMLLIFSIFGTLRFDEVNAMAGQLSEQGLLAAGTATLITLLLFVGATGKSAQLPLWVWLPDAMEGPTPVSALIHAATMVTAGVYMIARTNALWALAPVSGAVVAVVGAATALFAATIALTQYDLKRVLAYSTISQLGLMFLAVGVGAYTAGVFHLVTHAFFKALLFLAAGSVMHALGNKIDLREMGQLRRFMPKTHWTFAIGTLAIAGFPFLAGWWSKDEILYETLAMGVQVHWPLVTGQTLMGVGLLVSLMTAFYMGRAYFLAFWSDKRLDAHTEEHVHESPASMTVPLQILAVLSVFAGIAMAGRSLMGHEAAFTEFLKPVWEPSQAILAAHGHAEHHAAAFGPNVMKVIASVVGIGGLLAAMALYRTRFQTPEPTQRGALAPVWRFFDAKWHIERAYHFVFVRGGMALAEVLAGPVDQKGIDGAVNGVGDGVKGLGEVLRRVQSGYVRSYAFSIFLGGVVVMVAYLALR